MLETTRDQLIHPLQYSQMRLGLIFIVEYVVLYLIVSSLSALQYQFL